MCIANVITQLLNLRIVYEGQCSMPNEYLGANMRYTGRSCGDKVYYGCDVGDFAGFAVDTCIRYHNTSNGEFENGI